MKLTHDDAADALRILSNAAPVEGSDREKPGVILDHNKSGDGVALEILDASERIESPRSPEHTVAG